MATLIDVERVKFLCSCKRLKPISNLYYCKYCKPLALKCKECVLHEIDQKYFCANCFDNKTHIEASATKFKCLNCFACPLCKNSLYLRASSGTAAQKAALKAAHLAAEQNKILPPTETSSSTHPVASKVYYLMCSFCRWTTRDVAIPDVTTIPGNWRQPENPNAKRIKELLEAYKVIAAREKLEKDRKKYTNPKRRTFHLTTGNSAVDAFRSGGVAHADKYGIMSPANRRLKNVSQGGSSGGGHESNQESFEDQIKGLLKPAETVETFEEIVPEEFFLNTNVNSITTIQQRHSNPELQPSRSINLYPLNKFYVNKESKRCNGCEHNVLKPESNITSIRFKLHQMALFMLPDIRIVTIPEWKLNQPSQVILAISNKSEIDMNIEFLPLDPEDLENLSGFSSNADINFDLHTKKVISIERQDSAKSQIASLKPDDLTTNGFVCFRRDNKIAVSLSVTPKLLSGRVRIAFGLRHCLDQKAIANDVKVPSVVQKVFVDFGGVRLEDGSLNVIERPKYIEDCLIPAGSKTSTTVNK